MSLLALLRRLLRRLRRQKSLYNWRVIWRETIPRDHAPTGLVFHHPAPLGKGNTITMADTTATLINITDDQLEVIDFADTDALGVPTGVAPTAAPVVTAQDDSGNDISTLLDIGWSSDFSTLYAGRAPFVTGQPTSVTGQLNVTPDGGAAQVFPINITAGAATGFAAQSETAIDRTALPAGITLVNPSALPPANTGGTPGGAAAA
jgi:hypothetical protein